MDKTKVKIYDGYTGLTGRNKKRPVSIDDIAAEAGLKESQITKYFNSPNEIARHFWADLMEETLIILNNQEEALGYSVNEKLLGFYFTWIEQLAGYRDYVVYTFENKWFYEIYPSEMELFRDKFLQFADRLVEEGMASGEIASRPVITSYYNQALWLQPLSIIRFWVKDTSENREETDALIEKTVNFSFDLMRSNTFDSFVDLAKFHISHLKS